MSYASYLLNHLNASVKLVCLSSRNSDQSSVGDFPESIHYLFGFITFKPCTIFRM